MQDMGHQPVMLSRKQSEPCPTCPHPPSSPHVSQVVSSELAAVASQRDSAMEEARRLGQRSAQAEQLLRAKEAEAEDLRKVYEGLALEHRRWGGPGPGLSVVGSGGHGQASARFVRCCNADVSR